MLDKQGKFLSSLQRLYNLCKDLQWYLIDIGHSHEQSHIISRCKAYYDRHLRDWKCEYLVNEQELIKLKAKAHPMVEWRGIQLIFVLICVMVLH